MEWQVNKCNETLEIAICDIAIQSQPLRQDLTWTVDLISIMNSRYVKL
jgi:hypothetical protein